MTDNMFSLDSGYIIVNYHYIRDPSEKWSGIHPCSVKEFKRQIEFLSAHYTIKSIPKVFNAAQKKSPGNFCALTFDDCLKDVYYNAVPVLEEYNIIATFFPVTSVFSHQLPSAHKIHILLSKTSPDNLIDVFNTYITDRYPHLGDKYRIPKDQRIENKRSYDDILTANFKETLIASPPEVREDFLNFCFDKFNLDERSLSEQLFMTKNDIVELQKKGMVIGSHSHNHFSYNVNNEKLLREDVEINQEVLSQLLGERPRIFSYPHGRGSKIAMEILKSKGFKYAVTTEKRAVKSDDGPLAIPRFDTNNIRDYLDNSPQI